MKLINFVIIVCCIFLTDNNNIFAADKTKSIDLNDKNTKLNKTLYWAAYSGDYEKVNNLIGQGAKVNVGDIHADSQTPLHVAVGLGNKARLDLLKSPEKALVKKRLKVVKFLISRGANVNARSSLGKTPLHLTKISEIAELLIKHGADVNAQDFTAERLTPLQNLYARDLHKGVAEVLISHGANIDYKTTSETTLLVLAVRGNNQELVELLIKNNADINFSKKGEGSALENAIFNTINGKGSKIAEYLISKGAYLTIGSRLGFSELHWAVNQNSLTLVKKVLDYSAPVDNEDTEGNTPLILAVVNNNIEIASLLINSGADVNTKSEKWNSQPLFLAKDEKMRRLLLRGGANANVTDDTGNSDFSYVKDK